MGGHGAGLLAAALGSRAKGVAINAGWPRKEVYGDSNTRYLHDQGAHLIEPALRGVLDATLAGSAVDAVASNLCCMRSLLRVGAVDEAVPPYHVRRIARLLEGCPSEYEEVPSKGHWWWDTAVANDGGTVNDERLRKFFVEAFSSHDECPSAMNTPQQTSMPSSGRVASASSSRSCPSDVASSPRRREA